MDMVCLDLEGVLIPEVWVAFAEKTGIQDLKVTTREIPDYDRLMNKRLGHLHEHGLCLADIQEVIADLEPMQGAKTFLDDLRQAYQVVILSDTFYEFASPLMKPLGYPTLLCHQLEYNVAGQLDCSYRSSFVHLFGTCSSNQARWFVG